MKNDQEYNAPEYERDKNSKLSELRPFTSISTPSRLVRFAFQVTTADAEHDRIRIERLAADAPA